MPTRRTKKNLNFPHFLKFKKFHFSIMLICAIYAQGILSTAISTGTKNRILAVLLLDSRKTPIRTIQDYHYISGKQ
jgi:hypothetical protein